MTLCLSRGRQFAATSARRDKTHANPTFGTFSCPADEADILAGLWYISVATAAYPLGEVRAQIDALGATPRYVVTVVKAGTGSGTVTGNVGGINCGLVCTANVAQGVFVLLTPTPDAGSVFSGWSFGCGTSGNCALLASADTTVTATFSPIRRLYGHTQRAPAAASHRPPRRPLPAATRRRSPSHPIPASTPMSVAPASAPIRRRYS
jgi:hypothetical protein